MLMYIHDVVLCVSAVCLVVAYAKAVKIVRREVKRSKARSNLRKLRGA